MPARMDNGENSHGSLLFHEEDTVGKASKQGAPNA
jgi:hypothetical protein